MDPIWTTNSHKFGPGLLHRQIWERQKYDKCTTQRTMVHHGIFSFRQKLGTKLCASKLKNSSHSHMDTATTIVCWILWQGNPKKVGKKIGKLLKIDMCTFATLKGTDVRICIQVPIELRLHTVVVIRDHKQLIEYEGECILCKGSRWIVHLTKKCPLQSSITETL